MDEPTLVVVAIGFLLGGLLLCCQVVAMEIQKRELRRLVAYWRHRTEAVEARLPRQLAEARAQVEPDGAPAAKERARKMLEAATHLRRAFERLRDAEDLSFVAHHPDERPENDRSQEEAEVIADPEIANVIVAEAWDALSTAIHNVEKRASRLNDAMREVAETEHPQ